MKNPTQILQTLSLNPEMLTEPELLAAHTTEIRSRYARNVLTTESHKTAESRAFP